MAADKNGMDEGESIKVARESNQKGKTDPRPASPPVPKVVNGSVVFPKTPVKSIKKRGK